MPNVKTKLWKWNVHKGAWFFLTLNKKVSKEIKQHAPKARGFGSVRVSVTIGKSTWKTSIFPTKEGEYLLPVKAAIRKKEKLKEGDMVSCYFEPQIH